MKKKTTIIFSVFVLFQIVSVYLLFSDLKKVIRSKWKSQKEELLSVVQGDISGSGNFIKVLKFKTKDGIRVEFLKETDSGVRETITSAVIKDSYNGFFEYRGQAIQLGMSDVDGDGIMEILAPSFDENLIAHLNVYYYDQHADDFKRLSLR